MDALLVSIIVPTLNEAENLPLLVPRIDQAVGKIAYEIIVVDDNSRDRTTEVCADLAKTYPVKLIVRPEPKYGLSGAVLEGFKTARGEYLIVMDADLQHPPEKVPELLELVLSGQADFAVGSRYVPGGSTEEHWGLFRRINSSVATWLARPFAGDVHDPMSGFFCLRRSAYQSAQRLTPLGYKIGLELMCKCQVKRPREIPIHFGMRAKGTSKLSLSQQFKYLEHLSRLYDFTFPRASPIIKFLIVLGISWLVGLLSFLALREAGVGRILAAPLAYLPALVVTAVFHARYVRTQREFIVRRRPWADFLFISLCELIACAAAAVWVNYRMLAAWAPEAFVIPFGVATVARYVLRKELLHDIRGLRPDPRWIETLAKRHE